MEYFSYGIGVADSGSGSATFTLSLMESFEESQLYYTTSFEKKQAGKASDRQHMLKTSKKDNGEFEVQTPFPSSDGYGVTRFVS